MTGSMRWKKVTFAKHSKNILSMKLLLSMFESKAKKCIPAGSDWSMEALAQARAFAATPAGQVRKEQGMRSTERSSECGLGIVLLLLRVAAPPQFRPAYVGI